MSTFYGQIILILSAIASFLAPEAICFIVVFSAVMADLFWGILAALICKKFILSKALRDSIKKIGVYAFTLLGVYCIGIIIHDDFFIGTKVMSAIATACELWSMSASMLIVKPDMPFIKIFRAQLKGEVESKLNRNLDTILKEDEK
jgi:hypothetical protein